MSQRRPPSVSRITPRFVECASTVPPCPSEMTMWPMTWPAIGTRRTAAPGVRPAAAAVLGVSCPVTRLRIRQRRLRLVVATAIQHPGSLVHAPRHELGAVPGPVPVGIVLRDDGAEHVCLAHMGSGEIDDLLARGHQD